MHTPIFLNNISLSYAGKNCFENFTAQILPGSRVAIIGANGSGKTSLLKIINGDLDISSGSIVKNGEIVFAYVPQIISGYPYLSGGEKFNKALSAALALRPDILLLDEPTNHLDLKNRKSLIKMLNFYRGTLIVVSHDEELLRSSINTIWNIADGKIHIFNGSYDDYRQVLGIERSAIEDELSLLKKQSKENHLKLMKAQERAAKGKERGEKLVEQKRWLPALGDAKASSARKTAGKNFAQTANKRVALNERLSSLRLPEIIRPQFSLTAKDFGGKNVLSISGGNVRYGDKLILKDINISLSAGEHLAITGNNGSGKTTLFKAILNLPEVTKEGFWDAPTTEDIGYLDQHYGNLNGEKTVFETLSDLAPEKTNEEIRDFLNDFLFKKNEEVNKTVNLLSGGEKARLSLAKIALKTPKLLMIDEITNNIDLETKRHVKQVLKEYAGALIIISHDSAFLKDLGITHFYEIKSCV
jgi:ATPase subunit of ABC transporter with duplicated ATPase domains